MKGIEIRVIIKLKVQTIYTALLYEGSEAAQL